MVLWGKNVFKNFFKKGLAYCGNMMYTRHCCGMIAMKYKVVIPYIGMSFYMERMSSQDTGDKSLYKTKCLHQVETT